MQGLSGRRIKTRGGFRRNARGGRKSRALRRFRQPSRKRRLQQSFSCSSSGGPGRNRAYAHSQRYGNKRPCRNEKNQRRVRQTLSRRKQGRDSRFCGRTRRRIRGGRDEFIKRLHEKFFEESHLSRTERGFVRRTDRACQACPDSGGNRGFS